MVGAAGPVTEATRSGSRVDWAQAPVGEVAAFMKTSAMLFDCVVLIANGLISAVRKTQAP